MKIFEIKSLSKIFVNGNIYKKALNNISLEIEHGEFIAVVGTSGSGKSTLLNIMGGLESPTNGQIIVNGINIIDLSEEERTRFRLHNIGFIFQNYNLIPVVNVLENIILPAKLMKQNIEESEIAALAERLGIQDKIYDMPNTLSGGQQQRVAIARALYSKPQVILADEPTGNLDSKSKKDTICLMREMSDEYQQTMIMVTHDEQIAQLADRIIHIEDGRVTD